MKKVYCQLVKILHIPYETFMPQMNLGYFELRWMYPPDENKWYILFEIYTIDASLIAQNILKSSAL